MQQHQLRLNFHLETARCLEQAHQHHAQRNLGQRAVKVRLTDGTNGGLQLFHTCGGGNPATFNVQGCHALVVSAEKRQEVLRQIFLVKFRQRANDAKVQRDIAAKALWLQAHHDVARVHVGVEKAVTEDLGEEQRHTIAGQLRNVHPASRRRSTWLMGTPFMRSMTMTSAWQ